VASELVGFNFDTVSNASPSNFSLAIFMFVSFLCEICLVSLLLLFWEMEVMESNTLYVGKLHLLITSPHAADSVAQLGEDPSESYCSTEKRGSEGK
jgi:hypothetical protein